MSTTPTPPPAGWFKDPHGSNQLRWWDGTAWTDHLSPLPDDRPPPSASAPPTPPGLNIFDRFRALGTGARVAVAAAVLLPILAGLYWLSGIVVPSTSTLRGELLVRRGTDYGLEVLPYLEEKYGDDFVDKAERAGVTNIDDPCLEGRDAFSDLRDGATVEIADESGGVIATTSLTDGELIFEPRWGERTIGCRFYFETEVPKRPFYKISAGDREPLTYSSAELDEQEWSVSITAGS